MSDSTQLEKQLRRDGFWILVRLFLYMVFSAVVIETVILTQQRIPAKNVLFMEGSLVESLQVALLVLCSVVLVATAIRKARNAELYLLLAFLPMMAVIREADSFFNHVIAKSAWSTVFIITWIVCLALTFRWRHRVEGQLQELLRQRVFGYLASGVIVTMAMSQLIGQKAFWKFYLGPTYTRDISRAVEEFGELSGYVLLCCGTIELFFSTRRIPTDTGSRDTVSSDAGRAPSA